MTGLLFAGENINHILTHDVSALFLEMGLDWGKTVITLSAISEPLYNRFEVGKVLVISPLRVTSDTWPDEIEKWERLKGLTYSVVIGIESERKEALRKALVSIWLTEKMSIGLVGRVDFHSTLIRRSLMNYRLSSPIQQNDLRVFWK